MEEEGIIFIHHQHDRQHHLEKFQQCRKKRRAKENLSTRFVYLNFFLMNRHPEKAERVCTVRNDRNKISMMTPRFF